MKNEINNAGDFLGNLLSTVAGWLPKLLAAALILGIGFVIAKVLSTLVGKLLAKVRLDERLHSGHGGNILQKAVSSPARLLSKIVFWLVFFVAISAAVGALGVPILTGILAGIYAYVPNVLAALLIFLVAGAVAGGVSTLVAKTMGDTPTGKVVATVVPIVILSVASFMILNQLKIAPEIVTITYGVLLGSAGLASALAFGLGGRETAGRIVSGAYEKGQANKQQAKQDVQVGKTRAERKAKKLQQY